MRISLSTATIKTTNHPLPIQIADQINNLKSSPTGFNIALFMVFGLGFLMAAFSVFLVSVRALAALLILTRL